MRLWSLLEATIAKSSPQRTVRAADREYYAAKYFDLSKLDLKKCLSSATTPYEPLPSPFCHPGRSLLHPPALVSSLEMRILFEHHIPRFQERSAELQIPRLRSG
jgi:hypothetical protein